MASTAAGVMIKDWRSVRRWSQLDLAHRAGVSPRHLSFVETGRSRPSPELLLTLAQHLEVPLRDRNTLLLAAGYAPRFPETPLDSPDLQHVVTAMRRFIDAHDPYPALVLDGHCNVVMANASSALFTALVPPALLAPPVNIFRISLHPDALARVTVNFEQWATHLLHGLDRLAAVVPHPAIAALHAEVNAYPNVTALRSRPRSTDPTGLQLLVPYELELDGERLSMFTTLTTFGTPRDITLTDIAVELFFPNDEHTEAVLRTRSVA